MIAIVIAFIVGLVIGWALRDMTVPPQGR